MIYFEFNGQRVRPDNIADTIMKTVLMSIEAQIREKVGSVRDPVSGEFPTVVIRGNYPNNLNLHVEGSPQLIELVSRRLGIEKKENIMPSTKAGKSPQVFLSYAFEDSELAKRIANRFQDNGIETWWAEWCIKAGDSLRQKIDDGLRNCTHFLVLLTPTSVTKPWVNQEMDAGLVKKLRNECRFLPVRHNLATSALPPLLWGMHAPEISGDDDIVQLINDIHDITRKPPLGPAPNVVASSVRTVTGYSTAANVVARYFVENTKYGRALDPLKNIGSLAEETGLTVADTTDALFELSSFFKNDSRNVMVKPSLFSEFDEHWMPWNPKKDALKLAADIMNDQDFPADSKTIIDRYGWEARRLNPAATYLFDRNMIQDYKVLGSREFQFSRIIGKEDELRRFLKSRS